MNKIKPKRIHIIGSVGSGKSTLARILSHKLNIPYYELDNVVWKRTTNGDIRNSPEERDDQFNKIIQSDAWIIEGVHYKWTSEGFELADLIIFLDTTPWKRNYRIIKRFVVQKLGFEKGNYKQTFNMLWLMYKWNHSFEKENKPEIFQLLKRYNSKLVVLKDNNELDRI